MEYPLLHWFSMAFSWSVRDLDISVSEARGWHVEITEHISWWVSDAELVASLTWWTWVWASSRSWWWTGRPGVLRSTGSRRVRHDWAKELNWTDELVNSLVRRGRCGQALWLWSWEPQLGSSKPRIYWPSEPGLQASAAQPKAEKREARGKPSGFNHDVLTWLNSESHSPLKGRGPREENAPRVRLCTILYSRRRDTSHIYKALSWKRGERDCFGLERIFLKLWIFWNLKNRIV